MSQQSPVSYFQINLPSNLNIVFSKPIIIGSQISSGKMYATAELYMPHNHSTTHYKSKLQSVCVMEAEKYIVAQVARRKLLVESSCRDHNLRKLVGHANLVDTYLAEHLAKAQQQRKYEALHVETVEHKSKGEDHVCEYILQEQTKRKEDFDNEKKTYKSLTVSKNDDSVKRGGCGTDEIPVDITVDYTEVEIDEKEVSEGDD